MSRSIRWRGTGIHTASSLANKRRRLDRHSAGVEQVLGELRRGAALHLSFSPRKHWRLSSGAFVTDEVARTVIGLPCVIGVGDALLAGELSQTFRFTTDGEDNG
jgi:hypothetical protein